MIPEVAIVDINQSTDDELEVAIRSLAPDFRLEEHEHVDPRTISAERPEGRKERKAHASGTIAGKAFVLELIVTPEARLVGARTFGEAKRSVLEGFYRTLRRALA